MEQSPSCEANWSAASQEIPRILWNPKVYHRAHTTRPYPELAPSSSHTHIPLSEDLS